MSDSEIMTAILDLRSKGMLFKEIDVLLGLDRDSNNRSYIRHKNWSAKARRAEKKAAEQDAPEYCI